MYGYNCPPLRFVSPVAAAATSTATAAAVAAVAEKVG